MAQNNMLPTPSESKSGAAAAADQIRGNSTRNISVVPNAKAIQAEEAGRGMMSRREMFKSSVVPAGVLASACLALTSEDVAVASTAAPVAEDDAVIARWREVIAARDELDALWDEYQIRQERVPDDLRTAQVQVAQRSVPYADGSRVMTPIYCYTERDVHKHYDELYRCATDMKAPEKTLRKIESDRQSAVSALAASLDACAAAKRAAGIDELSEQMEETSQRKSDAEDEVVAAGFGSQFSIACAIHVAMLNAEPSDLGDWSWNFLKLMLDPLLPSLPADIQESVRETLGGFYGEREPEPETAPSDAQIEAWMAEMKESGHTVELTQFTSLVDADLKPITDPKPIIYVGIMSKARSVYDRASWAWLQDHQPAILAYLLRGRVMEGTRLVDYGPVIAGFEAQPRRA